MAAAASPSQRPVRGCQTFNHGRLVGHLAVYLGGVATWIGVYVAVVFATESAELIAADTADGLLRRQVGTGVAGALTGLYFAGAYTRARGAPLPNLVAASAISAVMPGRVRALGATPPDPGLIGDNLFVATLVLSGGSAVTLIAVISWYSRRFGGTGTAAAERWEEEHFPPGFRLAVTATESGAIDWEQTDYGLEHWSYGRFLRHGAVVLGGGLLLYGGVLAAQRAVADSLLLQALEETPWALLAFAGVCYVWWLNRQWRATNLD